MLQPQLGLAKLPLGFHLRPTTLVTTLLPATPAAGKFTRSSPVIGPVSPELLLRIQRYQFTPTSG